MTIEKSGVSAVSVGAILKQGLQIPPYQRPYSWTPALALQLVDDLRNAQVRSPEDQYILGAVILHEHNGAMDVVDGQQRLLTLRMIFARLTPNDPLAMEEKSETPSVKVWRELGQQLSGLSEVEKAALLHFISTQCLMIRVVTDDVDEAFRVFDSQNYRGKPLAPHDLLKAHHLREMREESAAMRAAVVETWELATDMKLHRLFSTFLYRIARWSRGESAPGFTIHDIGMFKGILRNNGGLSPFKRYHLAAQAAVPILNSGATFESKDDIRDAGRSRFQLDAPLIAGRAFFEMVSFMLEELASLETQAKEISAGEFGPSKSRYRYVHDLFIAAQLYYTNKFGNENLSEARDRLFSWAYALRVALARVQYISVDNRARGADDTAKSPFILLRNAMTGQVVRQLGGTHTPYGQDHEQELMNFIQGTRIS